ncbi:hypothetical protein GS399_03440 [Pedobacter sp. HMF7647]|uniref:Glycosyltransferase family 9 protein n=1 Tax=Hufsiella arboris TaxID=2695275 RepID=A0A7K1Y610_9SPHI|nr:glycosyltransferase family 9 protein [Hufsiella arboris]MXV50012.1 hypothetical protein [Hufsiella arboris]
MKLISVLRKSRKRILIIKIDAVGDYILFRNFIQAVKTSDKYKNYEIDLCGNTAWKDITVEYDSEWIGEAFFVELNDIYERPIDLLKLGWQLFKRRYEVVLQPTYTRTLLNDGLAALACSDHLTGFQSDNERILPRYKKKMDLFYTDLLLLPPDIHFEFYRNKFFFETALSQKIELIKPVIATAKQKGNYVAIVPGAGSVKREWGAENFSVVIRQILARTNYDVIILGSQSERNLAQVIVAMTGDNRVTSIAGKTTLPEVIHTISAAECVITNDTSAIHIAAACNTPAVCIHGVAHYKRFIPYPEELSRNLRFVYTMMPCYNCNWYCIYETKKEEPYPCISVNTVDQAQSAFFEIMSHNPVVNN